MLETIIIKDSYNLDLTTAPEDQPSRSAVGASIYKFSDDVRKGKQLQTVKMPRFITNDGYDFLKFNFPVCNNISSSDLQVIFAVMEGFNVVVVGNEERKRRNNVIMDALRLPQDTVTFVPELDSQLETLVTEEEFAQARSLLSFTNTQARGYAALSSKQQQRLTLEVAGDLPILYNYVSHAHLLDKQGMDLSMNLNDVTTMQEIMSSFKRNGYTHLLNSEGKAISIKENNVFAETLTSVKSNKRLLDSLYRNRNGGGYEQAILSTIARKAGRLVTSKETPGLIADLLKYLSNKEENPVPYRSVAFGAHLAFSPKHANTTFADATNTDIATCMDLDGLNNDYRDFKSLFDANFNNLEAILPYAEQIYKVDEAMGKAEGVTTLKTFRDHFNGYVGEVQEGLKDKGLLSKFEYNRKLFEWITHPLRGRKIKLSDDHIEEISKSELGIVLEEDGSLTYEGKDANEVRSFIGDLGNHLRCVSLPEFNTSTNSTHLFSDEMIKRREQRHRLVGYEAA